MIPNSENSFSSLSGNLRNILYKYTKHWFWFILSIIICFFIAYMYIKYATPQYTAKAKIQILEDVNSNSELSAFKDLDLISGSENEVEDEIQIIKSRSNFIQLVKDLKIYQKVIVLGNIKNSEIYNYKKFPISANFTAISDSILYETGFSFFLDLTSDINFGYSESEDMPYRKFSYGNIVNSSIGGITITPNNEANVYKKYKGKKIKFILAPVKKVAQEYQEKVIITPISKVSNILNISLNDAIPRKSIDIINNLINIYNKNSIEDKKRIADKTSAFIDERIKEINSDLTSVDQTAEDFMTKKGITNIASQADINLNIGAANRQELQNSQVQLNVAASMKDIVQNQQAYDFLPSNVGIDDPSISSTVAQYNQLISQRNEMLKSSNEKNPIIVNIDQQLSGLKNNMLSSLNSVTNNLSLRVNSLSNQQSRINSSIYSAPKNQRGLRDITRKQEITESLYLYLLQKREEAQVAYASSNPKSKIIDAAYRYSKFPASPKKSIIFIIAFLLSILIPFSFIYINDILDNKIHNKKSLEGVIGAIPVLGELPKISRREGKSVKSDDRSVLAESLRIIRTNLDYILKKESNNKGNNVIFVTSSISGEGKTFTSSNLAMILASTKKKVLLVGADIRNPKINSFFSMQKKDIDSLNKEKIKFGLTDYLYNDNLSTSDVINTMLVHSNTIDVVYSGKIPPNPAELLLSNRMGEILKEVSLMYDYVIVDTAPVMLVTDTLLISKYASHTIYVTKSGFTETRLIEYPIKLNREGQLKGLSFVVNNVKESDLGYGGKYGYGYGKTLKKWWKF